MYVLLGIMLVSRFVARHWIDNLAATRECNCDSAEIGDKAAVVLEPLHPEYVSCAASLYRT